MSCSMVPHPFVVVPTITPTRYFFMVVVMTSADDCVLPFTSTTPFLYFARLASQPVFVLYGVRSPLCQNSYPYCPGPMKGPRKYCNRSTAPPMLSRRSIMSESSHGLSAILFATLTNSSNVCGENF